MYEFHYKTHHGCPGQPCKGQHRKDQDCSVPDSCGHGCHEHCGDYVPLPPPIPPVRYVPGMNVQDQLCNMADRVNTSIHRWNEIQAECYAALNKVVGAANASPVYYGEEVRCEPGYDSASGCNYTVVFAKKCDCAGNPIKVKLATAYESLTNSGAMEDISTLSFQKSAQVAISAIPFDKNTWEGPVIVDGTPGSGTENENVSILGFTCNGVMRILPGDTTNKQLCQYKIENAIGPVIEIVRDGAGIGQGDVRGSLQAIGYRSCDGMRIFLSCGCVEEPGMSIKHVTDVMVKYGCTTAAITSFEPSDSTAVNHAGMTYIGSLTDVTIDYKMPKGAAFWYIAKPMCNKSGFEQDIANTQQYLGMFDSELKNIMGGLTGVDLKDMAGTVEEHTKHLEEVDGKIVELTTRVEGVRNDLTSLQNRVDGIAADLSQEVNDRINGDNVLSRRISEEEDARIAADEALQNAVDSEAESRDSMDQNLQQQINTLTAGTGLPTATRTRKGAIIVGENLTITPEGKLSAEPGVDIQAGSGIIVNKVGKINTISVDDTIATKSDLTPLNEAVEDLTDRVTVTEQEIKDDGDEIAAIQTEITSIKNSIDSIQTETGDIGTALDGKVSKEGDTMSGPLTVPNVAITDSIGVNKIETDSGTIEFVASSQTARDASDRPVLLKGVKDPIDTTDAANAGYVQQKVGDLSATIQDGSVLPIATTEKAGIVRVGANLSVSPDGTLSASTSGEGGTSVAAGDGISVSTDEEAKVSTVSLNEDTKNTLNSVASKADASALAALQSTVDANKAITDANTQNIDAINTTVGGHSADITKLQTDLQSVDDTATEAMRVATDAETKAGQAETKADSAVEAANTAKTSAETALSEAGQALQEVGGKVNKAGDVMTGGLTVPALTISDVKIQEKRVSDTSGPGLSVHGVRNSGTTIDGSVSIWKDTQSGWNITDSTPSAEVGSLMKLSVADPTQDTHAATKHYADGKLSLSGGTMTGVIVTSSGFASDDGSQPIEPVGSNQYSGFRFNCKKTSTYHHLEIRDSSSGKGIIVRANPGRSTGDVSSGTTVLSGIANPINSYDAANMKFVVDLTTVTRRRFSTANFTMYIYLLNNNVCGFMLISRTNITIVQGDPYTDSLNQPSFGRFSYTYLSSRAMAGVYHDDGLIYISIHSLYGSTTIQQGDVFPFGTCISD